MSLSSNVRLPSETGISEVEIGLLLSLLNAQRPILEIAPSVVDILDSAEAPLYNQSLLPLDGVTRPVGAIYPSRPVTPSGVTPEMVNALESGVARIK